MEDNFNHDDFEEFLQDQVRNHRMYPSDAVWREIDKKLHGEKRWPALTIAAALIVSATVLTCVYFTPKPDIFSIPAANANAAKQPPSSPKNNILSNLTSTTPFAKEKTGSTGVIKLDQTEANKKGILANRIATIVTTRDIASTNLNTHAPLHIQNRGITKVIIPINQTLAEKVGEKETGTSSVDEEALPESLNASLTPGNSELNATKPKSSTTPLSSGKDYNDKNVADEFLQDHKSDIALHTASKKITLKNKFSYQLYVAPSVSYRKLLEDNSMVKDNNGGPVGLNYVTDVNKVVRHKPGTGIEAGVSIMYNLSDKVRVKSGFQFNMRQYSIEAYRSATELASIALLGSNGIDTVNSLSFYRNNNGYYSAKLVNRYYQLSAPIGIEWEIIGNKLIQLNVAGTIQPTYLLNRNAYLLSTNFKNYTESPQMIRQWNINSNIEAFISMKVGDFKWQLGPQLRYQPYSTFIPEYTIKEHLLDYGLKLGVSKTIN